jgi:phytoene desaturase
MAPPGKSALYVLVPVPHRNENVDWQWETGPFRSKILSRLESIGVEKVEERLRFEKVMNPQTWEADLRIHLGSTFSLAHTMRQLLHLRPQNRFEEVDGVFLVGGGTHPGSGLPVIYESAKITSRLMADYLGVSPGWEAPDGSDPLPVTEMEILQGLREASGG